MSFTPQKDRIQYGGAMIGPEERNAIMSIIDSQGGRRWTIGPESIAFESELAEVAGVNRAVVTNSGSSALLVGIAALKLPRYSQVLVPATNFPTAFNAIIQNNLVPRIVDVNPHTMNIDMDQVREAIETTPAVKAVLAVNVAGNPVDMITLREIAKPHEVKIILDNCDGFGTRYITNSGIPLFAEALADVAMVSFHAAHIITTGEGGAILTNDEEVADRATKMREWGRASGSDKITQHPGFPDDYRERYVYEEIGYNMKPLELQCAMGRIQLKKLEQFKQARKQNFARLKKIFDQYPHSFQIAETLPNWETCWFSFPFYCRGNVRRKQAMEIFERNNIEVRTIFSGNILRHPAYADYRIPGWESKYPHADDILFNGMFISVHPSLTDEMIDWIGETVKEIASG